MSQFDLAGKTAIVTGGGTGLGKAIALGFARAGANVVVASRKGENLDAVADEISSLGGQAMPAPTDVCFPEQVDYMVARTVERFGTVDILVNDAGGAWEGYRHPVQDLDIKDWDFMMNINLRGTFLCSQAAGKVMIQRKRGRIINIASICGIKNPPGIIHYNVAKAGIIHLTRCLALEWAQYNINVNCIAPGLIATEGAARSMDLTLEKLVEQQAGLKLLEGAGQPDDIANTAIYLASEASRFVTGETIVVAGTRALK